MSDIAEIEGLMPLSKFKGRLHIITNTNMNSQNIIKIKNDEFLIGILEDLYGSNTQ